MTSFSNTTKYLVKFQHVHKVAQRNLAAKNGENAVVRRYVKRSGMRVVNDQRKLGNLYTVTVLVFNWFMTFRWIACLFISDKRYIVYIGDLTAFLGGKREYFLIPII